MMTSKFSLTFDFPALQEKLVRQFRNLDPRDPSNWPALPRYALFAVIAVVVLVVLWFLWLSATADELAVEQTKRIQPSGSECGIDCPRVGATQGSAGGVSTGRCNPGGRSDQGRPAGCDGEG